MCKHKKWTLEDKVKIVKEFKKGATISYLNNKYGISVWGTVSRWNQEYDEGRLDVDNRGKRKSQQELEDIDILNHKLIGRYKHILGLETVKRTKKQAKEEIEKYVHWYNNERIQKKLGYLSPVQYRLKYSN